MRGSSKWLKQRENGSETINDSPSPRTQGEGSGEGSDLDFVDGRHSRWPSPSVLGEGMEKISACGGAVLRL